MTPADLKNEILTGPLAASLSAAWASGDDVTIASILNIVNRPGGYVESRILVSVMALRNLIGLVLMASRFQKLPDGSTCPFPLYTLFATVEVGIFGNINPPLMFEIPLLTPALQALVGAGLIQAADQAAILAEEIQVSRATQLGWTITIDDVAAARKV